MENSKLESLRDEIDGIDSKIVGLLNQRVQAAAEIGSIKNELGVDPYDPAREEQVFRKLENLNIGPLHKDSLRIIYREVISASIALEKKLIIGYLGPEATYTHQAAVNNFGSTLDYHALPDIPDVFQAVEKAIPDVRSRIEVEMIGTPLTCARFLRRNRGTYGGRGWIKDGQDGVVNLVVNTPLDGLLCVGDSRFPGPGVPAVAAGGMVAAHSLVGALEQAKTIDRVCK